VPPSGISKRQIGGTKVSHSEGLKSARESRIAALNVIHFRVNDQAGSRDGGQWSVVRKCGAFADMRKRRRALPSTPLRKTALYLYQITTDALYVDKS
jgi:hypothetical protein